MKYDEMMKRFRDNGFDLEHNMSKFYADGQNVTWFEKNDQGVWEEHKREERRREVAVYPFESEEEMVNVILQHIYRDAKFYLEEAEKGKKVDKTRLDAYAKAMNVFTKGVFKDVYPKSYTRKRSLSNSDLVKAADLDAVGISAFLTLLKKKK